MATTVKVSRSELPKRIPQSLRIGDDWIGLTIIHKDANKVAIDLTSYTVSGKITLIDGTEIPIVFDVVEAEGKYTPTLPRVITSGFTPQLAKYEIDLIDAANIKTTYFAGTMDISETI